MHSNDSLNRVYRVVWNVAKGVWQAVAETGRGRSKSVSAGRRARRVQVAALAGLAASSAFASGPLPTGGQVTAGSGSITTNSGAGSVVVDQTSDRLAIDWLSFNIGAGNTVRFVQPSSDSVALNRVTGSDPSLIQGELSANGHVFLLNPNGVLFSQTARVDVGGLTASTLGLSDGDFLGNRWRFSGTSSNAVVNQGRITTTQGGTVALIGARIVNDGTITTPRGQVLVGAGSQVTLDLGGPVKIKVEQGAIDALVRNGGAIVADGGLVYIDARAAGNLVSTVINQTGTVEARTLATGEQGRIVLLGDMQNGRVEIGGTLDASAPQGGDGGSIETSASSVKIASDVHVTTAAGAGRHTGNWLIDPYDITIAASGGDVSGATIASALNSSNVTIDTTTNTYGGTSGTGTITVNDDIAKTGGANTTLRLLAHEDIDINAGITSTGGHLNVELTADQDNSGTGSVHFGAGGHVVTNNGNFYVGSVAGSWDTVTATGQDFTMATGSYVDIGKGRLDIEVKHDIVLADNSGQATPWSLHSTAATDYMYYDSGLTRWWSWDAGQPYGQVMMLGTSGGSITTANASATNADIVTGTDVRLITTGSGGSIGTSGSPIRISGMDDILGLVADPTWTSLTFPQVARALYVTNTGGSSYVDEVGNQVLSTVNVTLGGQANATQQINLMGDPGGAGHIHLQTDGSGVLNLVAGDVSTGGVPGIAGSMTSTPQGTDPTVFPTSVALSAPTITFANGSVDTGAPVMYYAGGAGSYWRGAYGMSPYAASFTATGTTLTSSQVDGIADIRSQTVYLGAVTLGTNVAPIEVGADASANSTLTLDNRGGSTFVKVVDDSFGAVSLSTRAAAGEHHVLWSGGDHIDFTTDAIGELIPTLSGGRSDGADFTATQGVDLTGSNRSMTFSVTEGALRFDTNSVDLGSGAFAAYARGNNAGGKAIYGVHALDGAAEITAGDVALSVDYGNGWANTIQDLEFAHGGTSTNNTLTVTSYLGDISIAELSTNHFKNINVNLFGGEANQHVQVGLAGADNIDFSDAGGRVTIDGTSVDLSAGNRNFHLNAGQRTVQIDGTSIGTGSYEVNAGYGLYLNGDVLTNGGNISLSSSGAGIVAMHDVTIGSNADDAGNTTHAGSSGSILLQGQFTASTSGAHITVTSASSDSAGGTIQFTQNVGNAGGAYLSGLTFDARGATPGQDGAIWFYGNDFRLNGDFASYGATYLWTAGLTIDTEQGNVGNAGSITFGGNYFLPYSYGTFTFDTSTTAAGGIAGNVDLWNGGAFNGYMMQSLTIDASGGAGGHGGDIAIAGLNTTPFNGNGAITLTGRTITLGGDIITNHSNVTLTGDVQVANDVAITTWYGTNNAASGTAGSVTIDGALGASSSGRTLTIDTHTDTGSGWSDPGTDTVPFAQNGGAVSITSGTTAGTTLGSLVVNTSANGDHNTGARGAITVSGVTTSGDQSYTGATPSITGALTSGGTIALDIRDSGTTLSSTSLITAAALSIAGNDTTIDLTAGGAGNQVGTLAVSGAAGVHFVNDATALTLGDVGATSGITATGTIDISTRAANLVVASNITTTDATSSAVTLNAGADAAAGTSTGGDLSITGTPAITVGAGGRFTLYTGSLAGSGGLADLLGSGSGRFRYASDESASGFTTALGAGGFAIYREQPQLDVTASVTKTYDGQAFTGGGFSFSGLVNGDTGAIVTGSPVFGGTSQGAVNAGSYSLTVTGGLSNGLGYAIVSHDGTLTVDKAALTVTANDAGRTYNGQAWTGGNGVSYTGFVTGDNAGNSVTGSVGYGGASQGAVNAGSYDITASGLSSGNYAITYAPGTLTIDKAALTVTANDAGRTYNGQAWTGGNGVSYTGFVTGDNAGNSLTGSATFGGTSQGAVNAGSYGISVSGLSSGNYAITYAPGTLTIDKAALTVTANDAGRTYNGQAWTGGNGVSYTGFVTGDNAGNSLTGSATFGGTSQGAVNAGSYGISVSGFSSGNYAITYAPGTLTIDKAALTVTANDAGRTYNGQAWTGGNGVSYTGFVTGDNAGNSVTGSVGYGGASQGAVNAGSYDITASGLSSGNYAITYAPGTLTIDKAALTVTANDAGRTYNGQAWTGGNGVSYTGFVTGDNAGNSLTGSATFGGTSQGAVNAGSYGLSVSGFSSGNYAITYAPGTLTIDKAALTVTANDAGRTYNGQAWTGGNGVSYTGFVTGDNAGNSLTGSATFGGTSQGAVNAGSYGISVSGFSSGNYAITYAPGTLTIDKAALTVTANDAGRTYNGQAWTGGNGVSYTGFVTGDNAGNSLTGSATYGGTSQGAVNAGSYGLSVSGFSSGNYAITYAPGTLTIDKAALTVTANDAGRTYNGQAWTGGNGLSYTGFVTGDNAGNSLTGTATFGGTSQGAVNAGSYGLSVSGFSSGNYAITYAPGTLTIDKAALTVTANDAGRTYNGQAWTGGNGVSYTGFVTGDNAGNSLTGSATFGGTSQGAVNAGSYGLSVSGFSSGNYAITYAPGTLTIDKAALTITANDVSKYVDGLAWHGGNGVSYHGFVGNDNAAGSLGGSAVYGGSAQGAIAIGDYGISVSGFTAANYDIHYVDGLLHVLTLPPPVVAALTLAQGVTLPVPNGLAGTTLVPQGAGTQVVVPEAPQILPAIGLPANLRVIDGGINVVSMLPPQ